MKGLLRIAAVLSTSLVFPSALHAAEPTMEDILKAWKSRQDRARSLRFELKREVTIPKGSYTAKLAMLNRKGKAPFEPPTDMTATGTATIRIMNDFQRIDTEKPCWDPYDNIVQIRRSVETSDGKTRNSISPSMKSGERHTASVISVGKNVQSANFVGFYPIFNSYRAFHNGSAAFFEQFEIVPGRVQIKNRNTVAIELVNRQSKTRETLHLDPDREYIVLRRIIYENEVPSWQLDVDYIADKTAGQVPQRWDYYLRDKVTKECLECERITVTSYEFDGVMQEEDFIFKPAVGTRIIDTRTKAETQSIVQDDGSQGRSIPTRELPTMASLRAAGTSTDRGRYYTAAIATFFATTILAVYFYKQRKAPSR
jgi:hypothetical protein